MAIGYAELKRRLDRANEYVPVRLGERNAQTTWVLARAGAPVPEFLTHVLLRVGDVMRTDFPVASDDEPVREVGLTTAREAGPRADRRRRPGAHGVMTKRALARRYIGESREASRLEVPTAVGAIVHVSTGTSCRNPGRYRRAVPR